MHRTRNQWYVWIGLLAGLVSGDVKPALAGTQSATPVPTPPPPAVRPSAVAGHPHAEAAGGRGPAAERCPAG